MGKGIQEITIKGFKSIKELTGFKLGNLNVFIGANGAGKSNFIQIFDLLYAILNKGLAVYVLQRGGANDFLFNGPDTTKQIDAQLSFNFSESGENAYRIELRPTHNGRFLLHEFQRLGGGEWTSLGSPEEESHIEMYDPKYKEVYDFLSSIIVYHFRDTGLMAPMHRYEIIEDCKRLRSDGANIAPFLLSLREKNNKVYKDIRDTVRFVLPFFDDFLLDVVKMGPASKVCLNWKQKGSNYPMQPYHLSDGSIRLIGLVTALLQPNPPSTLVIDEPELGLHPAAIPVISELIRVVSQDVQIIVATQSPEVVNDFSLEDIVVVKRKDGASTFSHLNPKDYELWLKRYSVGDLWARNVIDGGPSCE